MLDEFKVRNVLGEGEWRTTSTVMRMLWGIPTPEQSMAYAKSIKSKTYPTPAAQLGAGCRGLILHRLKNMERKGQIETRGEGDAKEMRVLPRKPSEEDSQYGITTELFRDVMAHHEWRSLTDLVDRLEPSADRVKMTEWKMARQKRTVPPDEENADYYLRCAVQTYIQVRTVSELWRDGWIDKEKRSGNWWYRLRTKRAEGRGSH